MARTQPETLLSQNIQAAFKEIRELEVTKYHGSPQSRSGEPDLLGCYVGRMFCIELKQPGEETTLLQRFRLRAWYRAGANVGIARTVQQAIDIAILGTRYGWDEIWDDGDETPVGASGEGD